MVVRTLKPQRPFANAANYLYNKFVHQILDDPLEVEMWFIRRPAGTLPTSKSASELRISRLRSLKSEIEGLESDLKRLLNGDTSVLFASTTEPESRIIQIAQSLGVVSAFGAVMPGQSWQTPGDAVADRLREIEKLLVCRRAEYSQLLLECPPDDIIGS